MTGVEEAVLRLASREERAGEDLRKLAEEARAIRNLLNGLHSRYNRQVVEQAAILGVLSSDIFGDPAKAKAAAPYIAKRLNALSEEKPNVAGKASSTKKRVYLSTRTLRGVKTVAIIDHALLGSADARKLDEFAPLCKRSTKSRRRQDATSEGRDHRRFTGRSVCSRPLPARAARA